MKVLPLLKKHYPEVAEIYSNGQATGIATFETTVPSWKIFDAKFLLEGRFVGIENDQVVAWCALTSVSKREVYKGVAETTIYVAKEAQHRGIGHQLLSHLVQASEEFGFWTLQARIFPQNIASIKLHENCGFRIVGYREKIGQRHGIWYDNIEMERRSRKVHFPN